MADHPGDRRAIVAGVFETQEAAAAALQGLVEAHFEPDDDVSIVLTDPWTLERENVTIRDEIELVDGARIGGAAGGLIGAIGAGLVAAGLVAGPAALIAVGPVVAALEGALAVGAVGVVMGWLVGLGIEHEEADFHAARIKEGAVWVGVHATGDRAATAHAVLERAGAHFYEPGSGMGSEA